MARIAIAGFMHETNCFVPDPTDYDDFAYPADRPGMPRGDDMLAEFEEKGAATAGFMAGNDGNHEIYPLLWASATPGGAVTGGGVGASCRHAARPQVAPPQATRRVARAGWVRPPLAVAASRHSPRPDCCNRNWFRVR